VPICVMTFSDVVRPPVQSALLECSRLTRSRSHHATIARDV
jgi:hypothetical protein